MVDDGPQFFFDERPFNKMNGNEKIVGGNDTTIESHPHQLSLRRLNRHDCGGSILTPTRALTAAHCMEPGVPPWQYTILAGSTSRLGSGNQQLRTLNRLLRHPQYGRRKRFSNNVGLLFWERPLSFGANVGAITLAPQNSPVPYGRNCNVTGWGALREGGPLSNTLQVVTKRLFSNAACNRVYNGRITPDMLCAGLAQGSRDACRGDMGGPLTVNGVQFGVASWGIGCARPRHLRVYARVPRFTNWIRENL